MGDKNASNGWDPEAALRTYDPVKAPNIVEPAGEPLIVPGPTVHVVELTGRVDGHKERIVDCEKMCMELQRRIDSVIVAQRRDFAVVDELATRVAGLEKAVGLLASGLNQVRDAALLNRRILQALPQGLKRSPRVRSAKPVSSIRPGRRGR